jgi:hypothetical protein
MKARKRKDVIDRFREFYLKLPGHEQNELYDLLAMVRGPDNRIDNGSNDLPKMSTSVQIRYLLFGDLWKSDRAEASYTYEELLELVGFHFSSHADYANEALKKLGRRPILISERRDKDGR